MEEGEREEGWCNLSIYSLSGFWVLLAYRFRGLWAYGLTGTGLWA